MSDEQFRLTPLDVRRWEFGNVSGLINPEIEICVSAPSGAIPQPASIRTQYWHVTMQ